MSEELTLDPASIVNGDEDLNTDPDIDNADQDVDTDPNADADGNQNNDTDPDADSDANVDADSDTELDENGKPKKIDGRTLNKDSREALARFRDADPSGNGKLAKHLREQLGHAEAYQQAFPTVQEARVAKTTIDALGGMEGLATIQATVAQVEESDALIADGNPAILEQMFDDADAKAGLIKLAPHYLDKLEKEDSKAYAAALQPHLIANLETAGAGGAIAELHAAFQSGDTARAEGIAKQLLAWYQNQKQIAAQGRQSLNNPDRQRLDEEWKKVNTEKEKTFNSQWQKSTNEHAGSEIWKNMTPYVKGLNDSQKKSFAAEIVSTITARLNADGVYQKQKNAMLTSKTRDVNRIVSFQNAKIDTLVSKVVQEVAANRRLTASKGTVRQAPAGKQGTKPGEKAAPGVQAPKAGLGSVGQPMFVKDKPREHIDYTKDKDHLFEMAGKAFMKSGPMKGKWVTWRQVSK